MELQSTHSLETDLGAVPSFTVPHLIEEQPNFDAADYARPNMNVAPSLDLPQDTFGEVAVPLFVDPEELQQSELKQRGDDILSVM